MVASESKDSGKSLCDVVLELRTTEDCERLLRDLLSVTELKYLQNRWRVIKLVHEGRKGSEIREQLGVSRTTVSRANQAYHHGTGILKKILDRGDNP